MRCPQCGFEAAQGATFCSRCGARLIMPKPESVREYALTRILPSWWHYARHILLAMLMAGGGAYLVIAGRGEPQFGFSLIALAAAFLGATSIMRRHVSWSLTSDRVIERRGLLSSRRREMELADVRSIEVDRSLAQRMLGLGNVAVASAASADFIVRMTDIPDPERVAEILRRARLKRLA